MDARVHAHSLARTARRSTQQPPDGPVDRRIRAPTRVRAGDIGVVLVERSDRLARDLMVSEVILRRLVDLGVGVIAADSGTDLTVADGDPTRRLVRQLLAAVAEFDRAMTVAKLRAARERVRKARGRCEGLPPYGERDGEVDTLKRGSVFTPEATGWSPDVVRQDRGGVE